MTDDSKLKQVRKSKGFTLKDVEHSTGVNTGTLSRYERGEQEPRVGRLRSLANFYGVDLMDLLDEATVL